MDFTVSKTELITIIESCKTRAYSEDIELLSQKGDNLVWLISGLQTHQKDGISSNQNSISRRKDVFGSNQKPVHQLAGFFELFCEAMEDFTLRILLVAACFSIVIETATAPNQEKNRAWIEGFAILVAVFVSATVTAANDYQKQRQFQQLNSVADQKKRVTVRRNGILLQIHQDLVLVGDVVMVNEGMQIPADGILIESNEITTDESAMTGEIDPINKNVFQSCVKRMNDLVKQGLQNETDMHQVPSPVLMSGTRVLSGEGKMIVLVVGDQSCIGKIRAQLQKEDKQQTPLQQKLQKVANDIGKFGLYSAIFIVIVLLIRFLAEKIKHDDWSAGHTYLRILDFIILGITVVVVAIPEGLPLSVTLSLAFSVKKMLKDQNLVRKMQACETMGGANNICSDKTGTLTMNKMELTCIWNDHIKEIDPYQTKFKREELSKNQQFLQLFKIATLVNSTALLYPQEKGSSTEIALLKYFRKMDVDYQKERAKYQSILKFPFSSSRKRMSIVVNYDDAGHLFIKGASQIILQSCMQWYNSEKAELQDITSELRNKFQQIINGMAQKSLRTLCLGFKKLAAHEDLQHKDGKGVYPAQKQNIVLLAIIGVRDNPREEVPEAIRKCHRAGITVRMVTGDNLITATAIAKQIGLVSDEKEWISLQGPDFNRLVGGVVCKLCKTAICDCPTNVKQAKEVNKELRVDTVANKQEFDKIQDKLLILARSRPQDKYTLVTGLKQRGNVVAVTGDGTNDAPALKKADVGFAMGQSGTQVARQAAAIILIDDNFNSIVKAVLWGRNIYDSIRKFIQFQLTVNVVAVFITLVGALIIQKQVLKPIQMLWVNLIMDTLASLALATEQPVQQLLNRKPHSRDDYIISNSMMKHIVGQSIFQIIIMMILVFAGDTFIPEYVDSYDAGKFFGRPELKWAGGVVGGTVRSGRFYAPSGYQDYVKVFDEFKVYSRHFTFIFNTFVMMQVFNFINARKLHEEFNIFEGITRNPIFIIIVFAILAIQAVLVTLAGEAFGVYSNYGLTVEQWFITLGFGSLSLVVSFLLKLLPIGKEVHQNVQKIHIQVTQVEQKQKEVSSYFLNPNIVQVSDTSFNNSHFLSINNSYQLQDRTENYFRKSPSHSSNKEEVEFQIQQ